MRRTDASKWMRVRSFEWMSNIKMSASFTNVNVCWFKYGKHIISQYLIVILLSEFVYLHAVNQYLTICPSLKSKYDDVCQSTWGSMHRHRHTHTHTMQISKYKNKYIHSLLILTPYIVLSNHCCQLNVCRESYTMKIRSMNNSQHPIFPNNKTYTPSIEFMSSKLRPSFHFKCESNFWI